MIGPPGAGKSLAASRLPSILPPLAPGSRRSRWRGSPAPAGACERHAAGRAAVPRAPPHDQPGRAWSAAATRRGPGEATLAHRGVLFLDELCEFRRDALEALRAPLETGRVSIARARVVAAACPAGSCWSPPPTPVPAAAAKPTRTAAARRSPSSATRAGSAAPSPTASTSSPRCASRAPRRSAARRGRRRAWCGSGSSAARERQERRLGPGRCNAEMTPAEARECALSRRGGGAARGALRAAAAQRPRPRPGRCGWRRRSPTSPAPTTIEQEQMAQALQLRRRDRRSSPPAACPECLRRAWLLALLGSLHREDRHRGGRVALAGTAAALQRGPGRRGRPRRSQRQSARGGSRRSPSGTSRRRLVAAGCWACCRHDDLLPGRRCATPPTRPGR